jgi:hypothetical protein
MRRFLFTVAAMVVVALAAYLGLFQREALWGLWTRSKLAAEGYGPARTPSEAMDKFLKAIKDRNYEAAESYLGGDYAEQFHKGAKQGQPLGVAIDNLNAALEKTGVKSDRVKVILKLMDPFPTGLKVVDVKQDGDKAHATITEEPGVLLRPDGRVENWDLPPALCQALFRGVLGSGTIDYLNDNGSNYVNALERVKEDVKNDATTKADLERALRTALSDSK